jgi:hypothetical protein
MTRFLKKDRYWLASLVCIAVATHALWYEPSSVLTAGDWNHMATSTVAGLWKNWGAWSGLSGLGAVNIQIPFNGFFGVWSLIAHLGGNYDTAAKLTFFIPISLMLFLSPYALLRYQRFSPLAAFVGSVFYGSNIYAITNNPAFHFVYALAPLLVLLLLRALSSEERSPSKWLIFALAYSIGIAYEVRIMYIVTVVLVMAALWFNFRQIMKQYRYVLFTAVVVLILNLYWLLPTYFGGGAAAIAAVANRGLFGNNLFDMTSAFGVFPWNWTGGLQNILFQKQPVIGFYLLVPIAAFAALLNIKTEGNERRRLILFYSWIALIGVFLTKQSDAPLPGLYQWLYFHFPGFNLFREASKFYLITALGFAGLLAATCESHWLTHGAKFNKSVAMVMAALVVTLGVVNYYPAVTGNIQGLFTSAKEIPEYSTLRTFLDKQPQYFRTLWLPTYPIWGLNSITHPETTAQFLSDGAWSNLYRYQPQLVSGHNYINMLHSKLAEEAANSASVKYIIVPLPEVVTTLNDPISPYGMPRSAYVKALDRISWLKRLDLGSRNLAVFENKSYQPHVFPVAQKTGLSMLNNPSQHFNGMQVPQSIKFQSDSPTELTVQIRGARNIFLLDFAESFSPGWKLYLRSVIQTPSCRPDSTNVTVPISGMKNSQSKTLLSGGTVVLRGRVTECKSQSLFFEKSDLTALTRQTIFERSHIELYGVSNAWTINPSFIKSHFPASIYHQNANGSIDFSIEIYYAPQTYFYFGVFASGLMLMACFSFFGFIIYSSTRRRKLRLDSVERSEDEPSRGWRR